MSRGRGFDGVTKLELVAALVNVIVGPFGGHVVVNLALLLRLHCAVVECCGRGTCRVEDTE